MKTVSTAQILVDAAAEAGHPLGCVNGSAAGADPEGCRTLLISPELPPPLLAAIAAHRAEIHRYFNLRMDLESLIEADLDCDGFDLLDGDSESEEAVLVH